MKFMGNKQPVACNNNVQYHSQSFVKSRQKFLALFLFYNNLYLHLICVNSNWILTCFHWCFTFQFTGSYHKVAMNQKMLNLLNNRFSLPSFFQIPTVAKFLAAHKHLSPKRVHKTHALNPIIKFDFSGITSPVTEYAFLLSPTHTHGVQKFTPPY